MSCFFCNSLYHLSQYCNRFPSNISRKECARSKNCCEDCMAALNIFHCCISTIPQTFSDKRYSMACEKNRPRKPENSKCSTCQSIQKCIICFSKSHHTVFCPDRNTGPNIFCPTLDKDILPRFLEMFDAYEKCLIASFSPSASKCLKPEFISIIKDIVIKKDFKSSNVLITGEITLLSPTNNLISIESTLIKAKIVNLTSLKICASDFFRLLSFNTRTLICDNITLTTTLKFVEIIKTAFNLQNIQIYNSNIEIEDSWAEDLLKYKNGKNFEELTMTITTKTSEFNVEALAKFIKTKSETDVLLNLFINIPNKECYEKIMEKLLKFFEPIKSGQNKFLIAHFKIQEGHLKNPFYLHYFTLLK